LDIGFILFKFALCSQWAVYVIWVLRIQTQHIERLKQHFASTKGLELRWVVLLAVVLGFYVAQSLAGEVLSVLGVRDPIGPSIDVFLVLIVVVALTVWSLRPAPELEKATTVLNHSQPSTSKKYQKSALGEQQAERIANKLVRAMEVDKLYRDPNLTLSTLARHIGVSSNYASQTLNQKIGQSFFEFVNMWRIKAAIPLLNRGESSVLEIAFEVGFNSRSSFYSAFKRETGMTPTVYKTAQVSVASENTLSHRIGA
jgi:AraC-like DNA-binding protein